MGQKKTIQEQMTGFKESVTRGRLDAAVDKAQLTVDVSSAECMMNGARENCAIPDAQLKGRQCKRCQRKGSGKL